MNSTDPKSFGQNLQTCINAKEGVQAMLCFVHDDPRQSFSHMFNESMPRVDARFISKAYLRPQIVLAREITSGAITNYDSLVKRMGSVMSMTALHFRTLSYHASHSRLSFVNESEVLWHRQTTSIPLFVQLKDLEGSGSLKGDPTKDLEFHELKRRLVDVSSLLKRLPFEAFRRVREYAWENGTTHGAFRYVARLALLDGNTQITTFRKRVLDDSEQPLPSVIRQVHRLHDEALLILTQHFEEFRS